MASEGPRYPGTAASLANAGTSENANAWLTPANVGADDATEAQITAATYDSPDISELLVASNFGFASVDGTIDGITVEIDRRSIIASSGVDFRVQLANGTTFANLVGTNKATATVWPSTTAVATYGGAADTWTSGLTAAQIRSANFAVFLSASANIANADIGVDFIRVTVAYTSNPITVTPGVASLTTALFAPTISLSDNQIVTPGVVALITATFAPTVSIGSASNAPTWTTPADTVAMIALPVLAFTMPNMGAAMHFDLQLDKVATFDGANFTEARSDLNQTGWEYWDGAAWQPVPSGGVSNAYAGNEARYTVQSSLADGTWYRRVRAGA